MIRGTVMVRACVWCIRLLTIYRAHVCSFYYSNESEKCTGIGCYTDLLETQSERCPKTRYGIVTFQIQHRETEPHKHIGDPEHQHTPHCYMPFKCFLHLLCMLFFFRYYCCYFSCCLITHTHMLSHLLPLANIKGPKFDNVHFQSLHIANNNLDDTDQFYSRPYTLFQSHYKQRTHFFPALQTETHTHTHALAHSTNPEKTRPTFKLNTIRLSSF